MAALAASWVFVVKSKLEIRKAEKEKETETAAEELEQIKATGLEKGSVVSFGIYGKTFDKHPIEWTILDKQDQKILLFSNQILEEKEYNEIARDDESVSHVTWENCSLRKWLNDDFYNDAFSTYEQNGFRKVQ